MWSRVRFPHPAPAKYQLDRYRSAFTGELGPPLSTECPRRPARAMGGRRSGHRLRRDSLPDQRRERSPSDVTTEGSPRSTSLDASSRSVLRGRMSMRVSPGMVVGRAAPAWHACRAAAVGRHGARLGRPLPFRSVRDGFESGERAEPANSGRGRSDDQLRIGSSRVEHAAEAGGVDEPHGGEIKNAD